MPELREDVLDDADAVEAADPAGMLRAVASGAAQVREAVTLAEEAGLARLADTGRPRSVVVTGMGGSGIAGDVLAALAGPTCPVPVTVVRGYVLPTWVGAADLVVAVSCSGTTEETMAVLGEAVRRGCQVLAVGRVDSPLHQLAAQARGLFVPVPQGRQPRASMWALATPLVVAGHHLGLLHQPPDSLQDTATVLEGVADRCRPASDAFVNPGKALALQLAGSWPVVWGSSPVAGVAAYRTACQLNENAKLPATWGQLPEANHNQVVALDGPYGARPTADLFADPDEGGSGPRVRLVLLRDAEEHPQVARRAAVSAEIAEDRGVPVTVLTAEGATPYERLASLVGVLDYATVYAALLLGVDPTPVGAIEDLKARIRS